LVAVDSFAAFRPLQEESPGPITIGGGKGEVGQRALETMVKEKEGWVVKRLIIQLSSRIFPQKGAAIWVPSIGWTTSQPILELSRMVDSR
jgi:hypothetical protein